MISIFTVTAQYLSIVNYTKYVPSAFAFFFDLCGPILKNVNIKCEHHHLLPWNPSGHLTQRQTLCYVHTWCLRQRHHQSLTLHQWWRKQKCREWGINVCITIDTLLNFDANADSSVHKPLRVNKVDSCDNFIFEITKINYCIHLQHKFE